MKAKHDGTGATKKSANGMQTANKTAQAYWLEKLRKRQGFYGAQIQFKGERHYLTFTQDKHDSATKAGRAYAKLLSDGWNAVLDEHSRIDRDPKPERVAGTVGNYIEAATTVAKVRERTFRDYCRAFRMVVSEIAEIEQSKKRFGTKGAKVWRSTVDAIPLVEITPARVSGWQKMRLDQAGKDPRKIRSAKISANTYLRQAKSLFGKRFLPLVSEMVDVPDPAPFVGVEPFPRQSMRYQSAIDPGVVLKRAMAELGPEPLKILTLALVAGLRSGEIDGLRWTQVNLDAGEIRIEATESFHGKSEDSLGTVQLDPDYVALLRGWKAKATSPFVVESDAKSRPKWRDSYRANAHFSEVHDWLRKLEFDGEKPLENANKPLHTLRKEAGSLVNQRHGLAAASVFLRHADVGITARFYVAQKERVTTGLFATPTNVVPIAEAKAAKGRTTKKKT
jgi:integrase